MSGAGDLAHLAVGAWEIDPVRSLVRFRTRHLFGLAPVTGTFGITAGRIDVAAPLTATRVEATASVASFTTGNPQRDVHVRSADFLDGEAHPDLTFRSTSFEQDDGAWVVRGILTAHGQDAPLVLREVIVSADGEDAIELRATARVDRFDHAITAMRLMAGRHLDLTLSARARRA